MGFMNAEITAKMEWVCVDGDGIDYIPGDLVNLTKLRAALDADDIDAAFEMVKDYTNTCSVEQVISIDVVTGYGVRSSASGYMDCTEWTVYGNKREAMRAARQEQRECDGLD